MTTRLVACLALLVHAAAAAAALSGDGTNPIVMPPPVDKAGAEKLFVLINGAYVPNTDYVEVAAAIQAASPFRLWVTIPSFLLDCPNPLQIGSAISGSLDAVAAAGGFADTGGAVDAAADVVVGGHSLGGIFSQTAVVSGNYSGLVLFGSYLSSANG